MATITLDPQTLTRPFDAQHEATGYAQKQLDKGRDLGRNAATFYISPTGCWSARMRDGSFVQAYERLGYHACTAQLVQGLLETGIPAGLEIVDRRAQD